jgi:DNA-binding Lrp family transcriptional regulator
MSLPTADEYFDRIHRINALLDEENIKIISAMKKYGPRNLQQISRKSGVPYPTVYTRVTKLEGEGLLQTWAAPDHSRIGLARGIVLLTPTPGREFLAREALKIPGYWLRIMRCSGEINGYYSLQAIPSNNRQDFEQYLDQLIASGIATSYRIFWLGDFRSKIPNFEYYDPKKKTWKFEWKTWLKFLPDEKHFEQSNEIVVDKVSFDKNDLLILKELEKNARKKLSEFAQMIGVTLPAAKYRFDNLVKKGLVQDYVIDILPYAPEISELYEIRLDYADEDHLAAREKWLQRLPFVLNYSRIRGANSVTARMYMPRGEVNNLITLLSSWVREGALDRFSYMALDPLTIEAQTFSYEQFDDKNGWHYDNREYLNALRNLVSTFETKLPATTAFQAPAPKTLQ